MKINKAPRSVWTNPIHFIAFGFGAGAAPIAPGTFGTVVAIPIYFLLQPLSNSYYLLIVALLFAIGVWLCDVAERDTQIPDNPGIVFDEIVGYLCTMWMAPKGILWVVIGFLLFRLFDITKLWPISWFEKKCKGGFGIMIDDVLAAVYAWIVLQLLIRYGKILLPF